MMTKEIEVKVRNILAENIELKMPADKIGLEDTLKNAGMDSLSFIKVVVAIEAEFGFKFAYEDLDVENFKTIKSFVAYIEANAA